jgi:hypothetical protein
MLNKILQWCRESYLTINMVNNILHWCRQSYWPSTWSTKYYNSVDSHTEHQYDQQITTMVQTVILNINMLNKILQWCRQSYLTINMVKNILQCCRQSYWPSTWSTKYYNSVYSHTEHQHDQQNTTMV